MHTCILIDQFRHSERARGLLSCCEFRRRTVFSATIIRRSVGTRIDRDISSRSSSDRVRQRDDQRRRREFLMSYYIVCRSTAVVYGDNAFIVGVHVTTRTKKTLP